MTKKQALDKACKIAGNKSALARMLGIERQSVQHWYKTKVPIKRAKQIEKLTGGEVTRADLCPDLFK